MKKLVGLLTVLFLTGCAALPVSGPVRIGPDLTPNVDAESFYYSPSGPTEGASQAEILSGFLAAGTGPQNDYAVAREFLSESIRASWNPNLEVLVQRQSPQVAIGDNDSAQLTVDVAAQIDADGRYETMPAGTARVLEFEFIQEGEQWRLSSAPDATVLIRPVFEVVFRDYAIYFVDRQKRFLVPEIRWFPATAATGTKLANALLRGPSDWLRPAVVSAIPGGTRLSIDAVTVEDGVALVDLTARALVASRTDRSLLKAQLEATLSQLPNVQQVAISIERSSQEITEPVGQLRADGPRSLVVLGESGLEAIVGGESDVSNSGADFFELNPSSEIAISKQTSWLAAVTPAGVIRTSSIDPGVAAELVDARTGIVGIEFDKQEYLWSLGRARGSDIFATFSNGTRTRVLAPWLASEAVRGFSISPEGSRIAVIVAGPERNRVLVSGIVRGLSGTPLELAPPIEIGSDIFSPSGVSWIDMTSLAVINSSPDFTNAVLVSVGGTSRIISSQPNARKIIAAGPSSQLYLLGSGGELYRFTGSSWALIRSDVSALTLVNQ
jgi:hypothetical protein